MRSMQIPPEFDRNLAAVRAMSLSPLRSIENFRSQRLGFFLKQSNGKINFRPSSH
jgi:hypothetical protein